MMSLVKEYKDTNGWTHEYYESNGKKEYICHKDGISVAYLGQFTVIKCAPRSIVDKLQWLIEEIGESENNNADIRCGCDVYLGEYIRVDISMDDCCYNVFDKHNMVLFSDKLAHSTIKKLKALLP